jgi:predicted nuclease with TOPRIM domain
LQEFLEQYPNANNYLNIFLTDDPNVFENAQTCVDKLNKQNERLFKDILSTLNDSSVSEDFQNEVIDSLKMRIEQNNEILNSLKNDPNGEFYDEFTNAIKNMNRINNRIKELENQLNTDNTSLENMYYKMAQLTFLCEEEITSNFENTSGNFDPEAAKRQAYSKAAKQMIKISA